MTPTDRNPTAELFRRLRHESGLTQRAFAEQVGTSGPAVAAYESGAKEPRLSTLDRMAARVACRVDVRIVPTGRGASLRRRRERRSLALAAATAAVVAADFPVARRLAEENLKRAADTVGDNASRRLLDEWHDVLSSGTNAVRTALLDASDHGHDMRQMTPFAGLLNDDERSAALAAADAYDAMSRTA